ncbi:hypothetical protein HK57_00458 [Aspergillus ustus]|uniref:Uncharacterized protein n=1 Tax=Aspergillus ustus TaxID=40382 RepID=A0A0C1E2K9_ASPUT|nr:hypothetical protein HK57_00458 [Aspergillus ustus]
MCFSDPSQKKSSKAGEPAYRINRGRTENDPNAYHLRTRASIQRHMDHSPAPTDQSRKKGNKRYPKRYNDNENLFQAEPSLYEYPSKSWPYNQQNAKGRAYVTGADGQRVQVDPEFTRTITDRNKNVKGVIYHPKGDRSGFVRAEEVNRGRRRGH